MRSAAALVGLKRPPVAGVVEGRVAGTEHLGDLA